MKSKKDKILSLDKSPLADDLMRQWESEAPEGVQVEGQLNDRKTVLSGRVEVGANGHPVTLVVIDEMTGAEMEFNHIHNALLMVEEKRKGSFGWLSVVVGSVSKIKPMLEMVASATIDELKKLSGKGN